MFVTVAMAGADAATHAQRYRLDAKTSARIRLVDL